MRNLSWGWLCLCVVLLALSTAVYGQGGTTQYIYDANGRLSGVLDPAGNAAIYHYDPAGNLVSIQQVSAGSLGILSFSPQTGTVGDPVTFQGVGLDTISTVSFNGTPAQIVTSSPNSLTTAVPSGATTGLITLSGVRGTVSTSSSFTVVARVDVAPSLAQILPNRSVQFSANVLGTPNQNVTWSVNGVAGGSAAVGTISNTGLYLAPNITTGLTVAITATSQADTAVIGQATVMILNPANVSEVHSGAVSVAPLFLNGERAVAPLVSVGVGLLQNTQVVSQAVTVTQSTVNGDFVIAPQVLVGFGSSTTIASQNEFFSPQVLVGFGSSATNQNEFFSRSVSATTGPVIAAISPASLSRGSVATVTLTGANLNGTSAVFFLTSSNSLAANITISNITASVDGSTVTFTATVGSAAATGSDLVYVSGTNGTSQNVNIGTNIVQIQ